MARGAFAQIVQESLAKRSVTVHWRREKCFGPSGAKWDAMIAHTMNKHPRASWIVDQLIEIRKVERQVSKALVRADVGRVTQLRFRLAELNRWLDELDRALERPASHQPATNSMRRSLYSRVSCATRA
jgi:hypothetical protein